MTAQITEKCRPRYGVAVAHHWHVDGLTNAGWGLGRKACSNIIGYGKPFDGQLQYWAA